MKLLEVSSGVRPLQVSLGVKGLNVAGTLAWTVNCHLPHKIPER